ncbi:NAD(P)-dependent oxidoreductase [Actinoplanes friuliensis]|uniref:Flavin reductase n=1 Tax=Actinoplanes friuliensis DSM 7358 TaxID=1246995 RepID=U5W126_9ACTN|nr:NAD(P)-binding oxidoreductase [Actinoplanes friuliensis]AGZ42849.1 Flavin reductase [Actinoplanes friuliensis DSM 7358]
MRITVLGASGATGRLLVEQALGRGHHVTAIARNPAFSEPGHEHDRLTVVRADVRDTAAITAALRDATTIVSGLGVSHRNQVGVLTAGARAAVASGAGRVLWMGAYGTGASAAAAGPLTRTLLRFLGPELPDKVTADTLVLDAGGAVFHCGPLTNGPLGERRGVSPLSAAPRTLFPTRVSRATVAATMLDVAEAPGFTSGVLIPAA